MANNKWVEVEARSIDDAIKAGLNELNLDDATQANNNIPLITIRPILSMSRTEAEYLP